MVLGACTAPAAAPSGSTSPTLPSESPTPTPVPTVEPTATTLVRTPEPIPTGSPQALPPSIRVVSQAFVVATAAPLIEVVGPYRTTTEADLSRWVPTFLQGLDQYRAGPITTGNQGLFESLYAPGPYAELIRQPLRAGIPLGERRKFELGQLTIQHMYAKPWGRVAYIDATLTYTDRITAADGKASSVPHLQQARFVNQGTACTR
jgi:hypothetical protein